MFILKVIHFCLNSKILKIKCWHGGKFSILGWFSDICTHRLVTANPNHEFIDSGGAFFTFFSDLSPGSGKLQEYSCMLITIPFILFYISQLVTACCYNDYLPAFEPYFEQTSIPFGKNCESLFFRNHRKLASSLFPGEIWNQHMRWNILALEGYRFFQRTKYQNFLGVLVPNLPLSCFK